MPIDFLIIGQGLAGSLLAWELNQRGSHIMVVDTGEENASRVSAGIINPITGMRFVKTADIETLLPAALRIYAELSHFFQQPFYIEKTMQRLFKNSTELAYCQKRLQQTDYSPYLGQLNHSYNIGGVIAPFGFIEQKQTGHLLTADLLNAIKQWLLDKDIFSPTKLNYADLSINNDGIRWHQITAKKIIFCEGYLGKFNLWFADLPFKPAKGEILTLKSMQSVPNYILNNGHWLLPLDSNTVRLGATFEWEFADALPTEKGKTNLLNQLRQLTTGLKKSLLTVRPEPVEGLNQSCFNENTVIAHQAGIRPCTEDKYPLIGAHPSYPQLAIFNGFGTKGSLQIPWYTMRFADYLLHSTPLPTSCDIQRYQAN